MLPQKQTETEHLIFLTNAGLSGQAPWGASSDVKSSTRRLIEDTLGVSTVEAKGKEESRAGQTQKSGCGAAIGLATPW